MAKQVQAWQSINGQLYYDESAAVAADATYTATQIAGEIVEKIRPAYSDAEEMTRDLMRHADLVIRLADELRVQRANAKTVESR